MQQLYYEWMCIWKNYSSTRNLKYSILLRGLGNTEQPDLAMAGMEDHQGDIQVPVAHEVRRLFIVTKTKNWEKHHN